MTIKQRAGKQGTHVHSGSTQGKHPEDMCTSKNAQETQRKKHKALNNSDRGMGTTVQQIQVQHSGIHTLPLMDTSSVGFGTVKLFLTCRDLDSRIRHIIIDGLLTDVSRSSSFEFSSL